MEERGDGVSGNRDQIIKMGSFSGRVTILPKQLTLQLTRQIKLIMEIIAPNLIFVGTVKVYVSV